MDIDAEVINVRFLKPLDEETLKKSMEKTKKVITIEDGTIINGLGTAIKELIIDNHMEDVEIKAYAYPDKFIQHGSVDELENIYHLDEDDIVENIQKHIELELNKRNEDEKETEEILNENKEKDKNVKAEEVKKNNKHKNKKNKKVKIGEMKHK